MDQGHELLKVTKSTKKTLKKRLLSDAGSDTEADACACDCFTKEF